MENSTKLKKIRLNGVHIDIAKKLSKSLELKIECKAKIGLPQNVENITSIALEVELSVMTNKNDELKIILLADTIFDLEYVPDDYNEIVAQQCVPIAKKELFIILDKLLVNMGYKKLDLAEQTD